MRKISICLALCTILFCVSGCTNSVITVNPLNELTSGCNDNGEQVYKRGMVSTDYFCSNKPWAKVTKYKGINDKYYNYNVFATTKGFDLAGTYNWYEGEYYCDFVWNNGAYVCNEREFINELKNGLSKREYTQADLEYLESKLISGCNYSKEDEKYHLGEKYGEQYNCKDKPWHYVIKYTRSPGVEYHVYKNIKLSSYMTQPRLLGRITWKYGKFFCEQQGYGVRDAECKEDDFIKEVTEFAKN